MKRFCVFCAVCIIVSCGCVLSVCAVSPMPLKNVIETADYYLYVPEQYEQYITFNETDEILYFSTTSSVNCLLIYKSGNLSDKLCSVQFGNIYQRNTTSLTYTTLTGYYQNNVTVSYYSGQSQQTMHITPISRSDIVYTDIDFLNKNDLIPFFIFLCVFCNLLLSLFFIFSHKHERVV